MKQVSRTLSIMLLATVALVTGCTDKDSISTGIFSTSSIDWVAMNDPDIKGIACHVQHVSDKLSFSDPSNTALACRQVGQITAEDLANANITDPKMVFKQSKSIFFKSMKVRRTWDEDNQTIVYTVFSTKETSGSFKHSLSTVPLWGSQAYQAPGQKPTSS